MSSVGEFVYWGGLFAWIYRIHRIYGFWWGWGCVSLSLAPRRPGHPPLASLAPPYAGAKGACWWLSRGGGVRPCRCVSLALAPRRPGHPPLAPLAPPYAGAKGAVDSCLRRNDGVGGLDTPRQPQPQPSPAPPRAYPCVLASLARVPFRRGRKGTGCSSVAFTRPARPPRASPARFARAPLRWSEGGCGWTFRPLKRLPAQE